MTGISGGRETLWRLRPTPRNNAIVANKGASCLPRCLLCLFVQDQATELDLGNKEQIEESRAALKSSEELCQACSGENRALWDDGRGIDRGDA